MSLRLHPLRGTDRRGTSLKQFSRYVSTRLTAGLTGPAGDERLLPLAPGQTPDHRLQRLDKAVLAVVAHQGVGLVAQPPPPEQPGVGNAGGVAAGSCGREKTPVSLQVRLPRWRQADSHTPFLQV